MSQKNRIKNHMNKSSLETKADKELIDHSQELIQMSKYKDRFTMEHKHNYFVECIKLINRLDKRVAKRGE